MAVANRAAPFIIFPTDGRSMPCIKEGLMDVTGFPNELDSVDGSLIPLKAPSSREDIYACRKRFHALNVQGICDSQNNFVNLVVKFRGQRTMLLYEANVECKNLSVKIKSLGTC